MPLEIRPHPSFTGAQHEPRAQRVIGEHWLDVRRRQTELGKQRQNILQHGRATQRQLVAGGK